MKKLNMPSVWVGAHGTLCVVNLMLAPMTSPWLVVTAGVAGFFAYVNWLVATQPA